MGISNESKSMGDKIILSLLDNHLSDTDRGVILNDLLEIFHRGYPISNISKLIRSNHKEGIYSAAWLLSELGSMACDFKDQIEKLAESKDWRVRFSMINGLQLCSDTNTPELTIKLFYFLDDEEPAVVWKSMDALTRINRQNLDNAITWSMENRRNDFSNVCLSFMSDNSIDIAMDYIKESNNNILRRLAFISIIRARTDNRHLLEIANSTDDQRILDFLSDFEK